MTRCEKIAQRIFLPKFMHTYLTFTVEKVPRQNIWAILLIFIKLPKVNNNPIGENSANRSPCLQTPTLKTMRAIYLGFTAVKRNLFLSCGNKKLT
jgi:hypothetical protein